MSNKMMIRHRSVEEAQERFPVEPYVVDVTSPASAKIAQRNRRAIAQRSGFEAGVRWAIHRMGDNARRNVSLAMFNAEAADQSTVNYPQNGETAADGQLVSQRMAFRQGAAWARSYLIGFYDGTAASQQEDRPVNPTFRRHVAKVHEAADNIVAMHPVDA